MFPVYFYSKHIIADLYYAIFHVLQVMFYKKNSVFRDYFNRKAVYWHAESWLSGFYCVGFMLFNHADISKGIQKEELRI